MRRIVRLGQGRRVHLADAGDADIGRNAVDQHILPAAALLLHFGLDKYMASTWVIPVVWVSLTSNTLAVRRRLAGEAGLDLAGNVSFVMVGRGRQAGSAIGATGSAVLAAI